MMSEYSIITFLKSLTENSVEERIFDLISKDYDDEDLLEDLLTFFEGDNDDKV